MEVVFIDGEEKLMSKLYKSKHQQRKYSIKYKYGLLSDDFWKRWNEQNGRCKTCEIPLIDWMYPIERLSYEDHSKHNEWYDYALCNIDHDHEMDGTSNEKEHKNYVRGFLCRRCNYVLKTLDKGSAFYTPGNLTLKNQLIEERQNFGCHPDNPITWGLVQSAGYHQDVIPFDGWCSPMESWVEEAINDILNEE